MTPGVLRCEAPSSLLGNTMLKRCCSSYTLTSHLLVQITSNLEEHRELSLLTTSGRAAQHVARRHIRACVGTRGTFSAVWRRRGPRSAKSRCRPPAVLACPLSLSTGPGSRRKQVSESLQMSRIFMLLPWLNLSLWGHLLGPGGWVTHPSPTPKTSPEPHASTPVTPQPAKSVQEGPFPGASLLPTALASTRKPFPFHTGGFLETTLGGPRASH